MANIDRTTKQSTMKSKVLFLCTHNSARSQIAEAFRREYAGDRFEVYSAGLKPSAIHPYTRQVMEEIGIDMSSHRSKGLKQWLGKVHFGYLITVCARAEEQCPIFLGTGQCLSCPFEDPVAAQGSEEEKLAKFREVRDQIDQRIQSWLKELSGAERASGRQGS